jgi:glycosyltransferase involved in cell wall biosynthesis
MIKLLTTKLDIIIPVYNDQIGLDQLLLSISKQTLALDHIQVIVVDNNSKSPIRLPYTPFRCHLIHCVTPGSYAARNKALSLIESNLVAFTDADCILKEDWIEQGVSSFLSKSNQMKKSIILAGEVEIIPSCSPPNLADLTDMYFGMTQRKFVEGGKYGITANLWVRSEDLIELNGFNSTLKSGGDRDFCLKANQKIGTVIFYEKSCIAMHPARDRKSQMIKCKRLLGGQFDRAKGNILRELISLFLHLRPFIKEFFKAIRISVPPIQRIRLILFLLVLRVSVIPEWTQLLLRLKNSSRE